ncbi:MULTISPECIES: phosphoribosyltransferase family protein [unclassified Micromonospora]|uniref:phosphoribosyltransferase family protein n=1 Tax=unclassified Micromonospora TaxID=2617518 RepID=UPI003A86DFAF
MTDAAAGDAPDPIDLRQLLIDTFVWHDPGPASSHLVSDLSGWWRHPRILAGIGPALAELASAGLADADRPSTVMTPQVTGLLVGPLVATALGVGVVPAYKEDPQRTIADATTWTTTAPDYRGRTLRLGVRDRHLGPGDRVLLVDDWVTSGAQLRAMAQLAAARGAVVVGSAVIVADCPPAVVDELRIRSLIHSKDL